MIVSVQQKILQLGGIDESDRWAQQRHWARLTALKYSAGAFHLGHWWRGPLLYSLVQYYKPRHILEFGTGRGYGALCMAQASLDAQFECTIWTIDMVPPTQHQEWAIDEGSGPEFRQLALKQVWDKHFPTTLTQRIRLLTGDSASVMREWRRERRPYIDFCFIDGGHNYWTVKHDFIAGLNVARSRCSFLFDDYTKRRGYGVTRLIDQDIMPQVPREAVEVLDTFSHVDTTDGNVAHRMALLDGTQGDTIPIGRFYSSMAVKTFVLIYQVYCYGRRMASHLRSKRLRGVTSPSH